MNLTLTADDIMAACTVGGFVIAPILGYIRFVHGQQSSAWRAIDKVKDEIKMCVSVAQHETYRLEVKSDLKAMEDRIIQHMELLVGKGKS